MSDGWRIECEDCPGPAAEPESFQVAVRIKALHVQQTHHDVEIVPVAGGEA